MHHHSWWLSSYFICYCHLPWGLTHLRLPHQQRFIYNATHTWIVTPVHSHMSIKLLLVTFRLQVTSPLISSMRSDSHYSNFSQCYCASLISPQQSLTKAEVSFSFDPSAINVTYFISSINEFFFTHIFFSFFINEVVLLTSFILLNLVVFSIFHWESLMLKR